MTVTADRRVSPSRSRRDEAAVAGFGTWMILGLFLDGWSHQANKPETFFSPWHGILYSGFVAAVVWFALEGRRPDRRRDTPGDRWTSVGLVLFVTGAVGDGIWHEVFGIEVDLEALLSPTHLFLFIGGFLMVTTPVRAAIADAPEVRVTWRDWWPQAATIALATALTGFFTMYLSALDGVAGRDQLAEDLQAYGVAKVLVTNALVIIPMLFVMRRWVAPPGFLAVFFGVFAVLMTGLDGFDRVELAVPMLLAGVTGELLRFVRGSRLPLAVVVSGTSLVLWSTLFATSAALDVVAWSVELWAGAIVLACASSALLAAMGDPRAEAT